MLTAQDIMTKNPITVTPETDILEAAKMLLESHFNGLPVVDEHGGLKGIICMSDLLEQQKKLEMPSFFSLLDGFFAIVNSKELDKSVAKMTALTVGPAMSTGVTTVTPDTDVEEIATLMCDLRHHTLPVMDNGLLVGVIGAEDILKLLIFGEKAFKNEPSDTDPAARS